MNDPFPVFQIFIPIVSCCCVAICCAGACRIFHRACTQRRLTAHDQARNRSAPVYVIPIRDDDLHRPPHYRTAQLYDPPPAYDQVKPEACPLEPPPPYTEAITNSPAHS